MTKIVLNATIGGFRLSHKAILRYFELKGQSIFVKPSRFDIEDYGDNLANYYNSPQVEPDYYLDEECTKRFFQFDIKRDDPILAQVVDELGEEESHKDEGDRLEIVEIPDDVEWYIYENEMGIESIHEKHRTWTCRDE